MEGGEGMVAVVQGLKHCGLAVTLLDGAKQYTLIPNAGDRGTMQPDVMQNVASQQSSQESELPIRCDSGAQATDGRYASVYKLAHCRMSPTSPPVQLTEFPPQRVELCRGHGNFEVGGRGSGESYSPCKSNGSFRGGLCWPDRGAVCSARSCRDREPDAFANSLRKYPNMTMDRSAEMMEKLINYTQAKNIPKSYQNRYSSPSRQEVENSYNQVITDRYPRNVQKTAGHQKVEEQDMKLPNNVRNRMDESPTREIRSRNAGDFECIDYRRQKSPESKYVKEVSRNLRESVKSLSYYPYGHPASPTLKERYETQTYSQKDSCILTTTNSVNMEVQVDSAVPQWLRILGEVHFLQHYHHLTSAAAEMVSKGVATVPRIQPLQRSVAVSLSPAISSTNQKCQGEVSVQVAALEPIYKSYKYVQTAANCQDLSVQVQATSSSVELVKSTDNCIAIERKSKSEDKLTVHKELGDEIMELLERVSACPTANPMANDLRRKVLKRMSAKLQKLSHNLDKSDDGEKTKVKVGKMLKYVPVWLPCGNVEAYRDAISKQIMGKNRQFNTINEVYRAEVASHQISAENSLNDIISEWVQNLPIKTFSLGMLMDKHQIIDKYTNRIQRVILNKLNDERIDELHADLLSLTAKIPMNVNTCYKIIYLNKVIHSLISKICKFIDGKSMMLQNNTSYNGNNKLIDDRLKKYVQPTENELRGIIEDNLSSFFRKLHFPIDVPTIKYVETELIDIVMESMQAIRLGKDNDVMEETVLLLQEISGVTEIQAKKFAIKLLAHIKEVFSIKDTSKDICLSIDAQSQNYMVLQNAPISSTQQNKSHNMNNNNNEQRSIDEPAQSDKDEKNNVYLDQLTQQIDEWLQLSQIDVPHPHDKGFRNIVIHDLAGDIIDRHKYLDLNPSKQGSDEDELEQLKYQIFKWINKLVGEENKETLKRAPELMKRIQSIPRPMISKQQNNGQAVSKGYGMQNFSQPENNNGSLRRNSNRLSSQMPCTIIHGSKSNLRESFSQSVPQPDNLQLPCCSAAATQHSGPSMKLINDEYDDYLKNWVKEIPMPSSTPEELAKAEKARQGIYNGVWQIITKLKFDPAIFHNVFYYEDALDEELEELFKCLPETTEMKTKKHLLKVKLIEKTTNTNEMIKNSSAPSSFRQQLVENVAQNLPTSNKSVYKTNDSDQSFDNEQIQKIVDNYVLCAKFKESNQLKADVYRKKLIQKAQSLIESIKKTHGKQLKEIDTDLYINSILNALHKVPLPNAEILDDEVNEIQVGQEVDQWFADLQCVRKNDPAEQQQTSKLKNALVKKIIELDKDLNITDCFREQALKHEVSLFLERMPKHGESANIDFMAEEFTNRLKNRVKEFQTGNEGRKSVAFLDSVGYYEFSVQMPACSSFSEMPLRPALFDQSSLMIRDGSIVPKDSPHYLQHGPPPRGSSFEIPSNEYFTIEDSRAPKKSIPAKPPVSQQNQQIEQFEASPNAILPGKQLNSCCQSANNAHPLSGAQYQQATEGLPPINQLSFQNQAPMYSMVRDNQLVQGIPHGMPQLSGQAIHDQRNSQEVITPEHRSYYENVVTNIPYCARNEQQMVSSIPNEIPPCCVKNNQGFEQANRVVSPTRQRPDAAYAPVYFEPEVNVSQKIPNAMNPRNEQSIMANVPAQVPPYYARNGQVQETNRVVSPTRQRPDAAYAPTCIEPEVNINQRIPNAIDPRKEQSIIANKPAQIPPCYARNGQVQETSRVVSPTRQRLSASITPPHSEPISNGIQRIPIVVEESELPPEANRSPHQGHCSREQIHQQQQQVITGNRNLHGNMTTYGQPQGFSTPQSQVITEIPPRRPDRKKSRRQWRGQQNFPRRRLDLEDDTDDASESDGPCHCMNRTFKCRRGPSCYDYEYFELDGSECYPYPFSCPHFY